MANHCERCQQAAIDAIPGSLKICPGLPDQDEALRLAKGALDRNKTELTLWLDEGCDCLDVHICGLPRLQESILLTEKALAALKALGL